MLNTWKFALQNKLSNMSKGICAGRIWMRILRLSLQKIVAVDDYLEAFNHSMSGSQPSKMQWAILNSLNIAQITRSMCLYVDNGFIYETGDVVVIDFTCSEIELLFIPLIPNIEHMNSGRIKMMRKQSRILR